MIDFSLTPELQDLQGRVRAFIREQIIPYERDPRNRGHGPSEDLRRELVALAKRAGLLSIHMPKHAGGLGLDHRAKAIVFEEAGYSILGPLAMNLSAPDEGNMHLLEQIATPEQKARFLAPLVAGEVRSCFGMTEPAPGAGADPSMLRTTARREGDHYIINGRKWFTTGAHGAAFIIIMAKLEDPTGASGATMFLADMDTPGIVIERTMNTIDSCNPGGHSVVRFDDVKVPATHVLGEPGQGFRYAQVRLSPARLTHCMRWLGQAQRAHDVALAYCAQRQSFGKTLIEHQGVGFQLVDNELDLHTARLVTWHCAWMLDQGGLNRSASSRAKVLVSEALWRVVDRCVQVVGGQGVTDEMVIAKIWSDMRAFRIYDGPSEVHRHSLAQALARKAATP